MAEQNVVLEILGGTADLKSLQSVALSDADLRNAKLHSANLQSADLRDTDLCGVDLGPANFRGADMRDVDACRRPNYNAPTSRKPGWEPQTFRAPTCKAPT